MVPSQSPAHSGYSLTAEVSGRSRTIVQFMSLFPITKQCLLDYPITILHSPMRPHVAGIVLASVQDRIAALCTSVFNIDSTGPFYVHFLL